MTEDRYWELQINHYDACFNALPWFKDNIEKHFGQYNIVSKIQSLYEDYFDKNTGPNIMSDELIADFNKTFYNHAFVTSKAFDEECFCISQVLQVIAEKVSQECKLDEDEIDFVADVCNAIMIGFGGARLYNILAEIKSFNKTEETKNAEKIVNDLELFDNVKGNWCDNDKVNVLLEAVPASLEKLDKIFQALLDKTI